MTRDDFNTLEHDVNVAYADARRVLDRTQWNELDTRRAQRLIERLEALLRRLSLSRTRTATQVYLFCQLTEDYGQVRQLRDEVLARYRSALSA